MRDELQSVTRYLVENLGEESECLFAGQIGRARDARIEDWALRTGSKAPDFLLPDALGEPVRLSSLIGIGPIVLVFYRGGWCPYCNIQLRAFQRSLSRIRDYGATLVAISPSTPDNSIATREREALEFPVLSDIDNEVAGLYGLVFTVSPEARQILKNVDKDIEAYNGAAGGELPVPATYVVDTNREIRFCEIDIDYRHRTDPESVIEVLRKL